MKKFILTTAIILFPFAVWAQNCSTPPSCATLGFTKSAADCSGKTILKCPFDTNKVYCDDAVSANKPRAGDIYYSDHTFSSNVIAGKTPIGIVAFVQGKNGLVIGFEEKTLKGSTGGKCVFKGTQSGTYALSDEVLSFDFNGIRNTGCLIQYDVPEAVFCNSYKTAGTSAGDWYLPATGELQSVSVNYQLVNDGLKKLSKPPFSNEYYISSSAPQTKDFYYIVRLSSISTQGVRLNYGTYPVRCMLSF